MDQQAPLWINLADITTGGGQNGINARGQSTLMKTQNRTAANPQTEAVSYARVSSKDQERHGFSIPAQRRLLNEYATERGLVVVREFQGS